MRVLRANHGFDYSFLYAIFMGNVLQPLNPHIGYADLVGHKLCADEHLISPSSSIWKLPRVALIIVKIIIALRHDYDFANLVSACLYQVMPITIRVLYHRRVISEVASAENIRGDYSPCLRLSAGQHGFGETV